MVMNAIDLARKGHSVCIYDYTVFGGAWAPLSGQLSSYRLDSGVHLLYYEKEFGREKISLINSLYNLGISRMSPMPSGEREMFMFNYPEFSFPQRWTWREKTKALWVIIQRSISNERYYYYFKDGCYGLQKRLQEKCRSAGVEIIDQKVVELDKDTQMRVRTEKSTRQFDYAILTSRSLGSGLRLSVRQNSGSFFSTDDLGDFNQYNVLTTHSFLSVTHPGTERFSVYKFKTGDSIFAVSDVRSYVSNRIKKELEKNNSTIYSFVMSKSCKEVNKSNLMEELIKRKLCLPSARVQSEIFTKEIHPNIPYCHIDKINLMAGGNFYVYRYDSLSRGIKEHLKKPVYLNLNL